MSEPSADGPASGDNRRGSLAPGRAQANLAVLAVALVALVGVTTLGLVVADGAFATADRDPTDRRVAVSLSERLVASGGPLSARANVLNATLVDDFDAERLAAELPAARDHDVRVSLDGDPLATAGDPAGGTTVRRVVLVQRRGSATIAPALPAGGTRSVTLPRRTPRVEVVIDPPPGTTVRTVHANGRVVLHDTAGLDGEYTVDVSRFETSRLAVDASGPLPSGSVELTYYPARTTKAVLAVTVDA